MATVPNWIARGFVYQSHPAKAYRVLDWRPTRTQVVVHVEGMNRELRFDLETLRRIGARASERWHLLPPDDHRVTRALAEFHTDRIVGNLKAAMEQRLDPSSMSAEELFRAIDRIQRVATVALAELGRLL